MGHAYLMAQLHLVNPMHGNFKPALQSLNTIIFDPFS